MLACKFMGSVRNEPFVGLMSTLKGTDDVLGPRALSAEAKSVLCETW